MWASGIASCSCQHYTHKDKGVMLLDNAVLVLHQVVKARGGVENWGHRHRGTHKADERHFYLILLLLHIYLILTIIK